MHDVEYFSKGKDKSSQQKSGTHEDTCDYFLVWKTESIPYARSISAMLEPIPLIRTLIDIGAPPKEEFLMVSVRETKILSPNVSHPRSSIGHE